VAWSTELVTQLAKAERSLAALAEKSKDFASPHTLVQPFIRREAVLSSRIEGTLTSYDELYRFETDRRLGGEDAQEVANYVGALEYGIDRLETLPLSLRLIRETHSMLFHGLERQPVAPGEFRRSQNWIGPPGSTVENAPYVPPPVDDMLAGLNMLERYIHGPDDLPVLARIGLIHYQFEAIHPFLDGNGRIGRLLIALLLVLWDLLPHPWLYLSGYFDANRQAYYERLLGVSERGDWEAWLLLFLEAVARQSDEAAAGLDRLEALREHYETMLRGERTSGRLMQVIDFLLGHPMASVRQIERGIEARDFKVAQRYVEKLVERGVLREFTGRKRNRIYRADQIFEAIEGTLDV
jgi:Fic family protein